MLTTLKCQVPSAKWTPQHHRMFHWTSPVKGIKQARHSYRQPSHGAITLSASQALRATHWINNTE